MQAPTHILTGILIHRSTCRITPTPLRYATVTLSGAASHILLDKVATLTYHPDIPLPHDRFWLAHHATTLVSAAYLTSKYWKRHKLGIIASITPDLDWLVFWGIKLIPVHRRPRKQVSLHRVGHGLVDRVPLARWLRRLPNWNKNKQSSLIELGLCGLLARWVRSSS